MVRTSGFNQKVMERTATMCAKKKTGLSEVMRDAATGYATVVLSILCFLIVLIVVIAGVRIVVGSKQAATTNAQTAAVAVADETRTA